MGAERPELLLADAASWWDWLALHHDEEAGVRLVLAKKGAKGPTRLTHDEALDAALCFGWIDGKVGRRDDATFVQRFTPRRTRSIWSARNAAAAERMITEGRMQPAGRAEVDRAKADGRWEHAYEGPATIEVPADLAHALAANPGAAGVFAGLSSQNRYSILFRLGQAKRPETRAARLERFVAMLARGETIYPQRAQQTGD